MYIDSVTAVKARGSDNYASPWQLCLTVYI